MMMTENVKENDVRLYFSKINKRMNIENLLELVNRVVVKDSCGDYCKEVSKR
jgi:hypothetical protein